MSSPTREQQRESLEALKRLAAHAEANAEIISGSLGTHPKAMELVENLSNLIVEYYGSGVLSPTVVIIALATTLGFFIGDAVDPTISTSGLAVEEMTNFATNMVRGVADSAFQLQKVNDNGRPAND